MCYRKIIYLICISPYLLSCFPQVWLVAPWLVDCLALLFLSAYQAHLSLLCLVIGIQLFIGPIRFSHYIRWDELSLLLTGMKTSSWGLGLKELPA